SAASTPVSPASWAQVETVGTHLGAVRELTEFALNAPVADLPYAFESLPAQTRLDVPQASFVIAHAFTTRATEAAIDYKATLPPEAAARFSRGFFTALASLDPALARVELLKIPPGQVRHNALETLVESL